MRGRPIATKCPSCKRGKYNYPPPEKGVIRTPGVEQRKAWRGYHRTLRTLMSMTCLDCGHVWWTTLL
jgi:uncharacterized Zn finger protein